jgi:hypothetical protein
MGNLDHDLSASIAGGVLSGWGFVLGPVVGLFAGIGLGALAAADFQWGVGDVLALAFIGLPILTFSSVPALLLNLGIFLALLRYLLNEEYRFEALLVLCWLTGLQVFLFLLSRVASDYGLWGCLRVAGAFALIPAIYVPLRIYARRRILALERQIEEDRLRRLRGESQAGQGPGDNP